MVATDVETTNNTDDDTDYRVMPRPPKDSREQTPTKEPTWSRIRAKEKRKITPPPCPFVVEFKVNDEIICSKVFHSPVSRITLVKMGDTYKCRSLQVTAEPEPKPKPKPRKPRKPTIASKAPAASARAYGSDRRTRVG